MGTQGVIQSIRGPLSFHIPFEQFRPSDENLDPLIKVNSGYDYEAVYRTFRSLTGLDTDWFGPFGVEHALAYTNRADAHEAHMVYHVNIDGFAKDFEVLRHRYWKGSTSAILYSNDLSAPDESYLEKMGGTVVDFDPISSRFNDGYMHHHYRYHHSKEEFHEFFHRIDDDVIAYFRSLSPEELQFVVELAAEETGLKWLPAAAGNGGAVVGPLHTRRVISLRVLIDFYEYLLDYYDQETAKSRGS